MPEQFDPTKLSYLERMRRSPQLQEGLKDLGVGGGYALIGTIADKMLNFHVDASGRPVGYAGKELDKRISLPGGGLVPGDFYEKVMEPFSDYLVDTSFNRAVEQKIGRTLVDIPKPITIAASMSHSIPVGAKFAGIPIDILRYANPSVVRGGATAFRGALGVGRSALNEWRKPGSTFGNVSASNLKPQGPGYYSGSFSSN